jgi:hypothetical protein
MEVNSFGRSSQSPGGPAGIMKRADNELFRDLEALSESSMGFWVNEIDDEVWELHNIGNHGKDSGG